MARTYRASCSVLDVSRLADQDRHGLDDYNLRKSPFTVRRVLDELVQIDESVFRKALCSGGECLANGAYVILARVNHLFLNKYLSEQMCVSGNSNISILPCRMRSF